MTNTSRINVTMSTDVLQRLDSVCDKLGCTRSSFITQSVLQKMQSDDALASLPDLLSAFEDFKNIAAAGGLNIKKD